MEFEIDKQSQRDLEIFSTSGSAPSLFSLFKMTRTAGGSDRLLEFMQDPMNDILKLKTRRDSIRFFHDNPFSFRFNPHQFDFVEHYLRLNVPLLRNNIPDALMRIIEYKLKPDNEYYLIQTGIRNLTGLLSELSGPIAILQSRKPPGEVSKMAQRIGKLLEEPAIRQLVSRKGRTGFLHYHRFDFLLRKRYKRELQLLLDILYTFDAYIAVAQNARAKKFSFPEYIDSGDPRFSIKAMFHPFLEYAVANDIELGGPKNLCFLTGSNMAGKSTFLKSLGICMYLAHVGFPVPAASLRTTVYDALITTINLPDSVAKGYSHFYSEVRRIRETALMLKENKRVMVIADELFRGTNMKDAYDASLLIIRLFLKIRTGSFVISTHLSEIADALSEKDTADFRYFGSSIEGNRPVYSYRLQVGVSSERLGKLILEQENIPEILGMAEDTRNGI